MNRRELLKGLAAFPMVSAWGCSKDDDKRQVNSQIHTLQIVMEGAFAVVIQRKKENAVKAFSVKAPKEPHRFYFNQKEQEPGKTYAFTLQPSGLRRSSTPEINPGFRDFNATAHKWRLGDDLVMIDLPCPKNIIFYGHREPVVFANPPAPPRTGWMPTNHILEYDVVDASQIRMICGDAGGRCQPSADSPPGVARFFFEIGPVRPDVNGRHAVNWFNFMLNECFPELVRGYSVSAIGESEPGKTYGTSANLVPAVWKPNSSEAHLLEASYTLDCKTAGIIVSSDQPPMPSN
jgi:hypothetical protein